MHHCALGAGKGKVKSPPAYLSGWNCKKTNRQWKIILLEKSMIHFLGEWRLTLVYKSFQWLLVITFCYFLTFRKVSHIESFADGINLRRVKEQGLSLEKDNICQASNSKRRSSFRVCQEQWCKAPAPKRKEWDLWD